MHCPAALQHAPLHTKACQHVPSTEACSGVALLLLKDTVLRLTAPPPQVEVLRRMREDPENERFKDALSITINGIAAGMRNTG